MPNFTELPERRFVDKAKNLSLSGKDSDTYFDGETLEAILEEIEKLKAKKLYRHLISVELTLQNLSAKVCKFELICDKSAFSSLNALFSYFRNNLVLNQEVWVNIENSNLYKGFTYLRFTKIGASTLFPYLQISSAYEELNLSSGLVNLWSETFDNTQASAKMTNFVDSIIQIG